MPLQPAPTWSADFTPPAEYVQAKRTSRVWPSPIVEPTTGRVLNWDAPTSQTIEDIGYLQVRINGEDVTWLEAGDGGPVTVTRVVEFGNAEPFDDDVAVINFPTIWPWDPYPDWLIDGCDIDLIWKQTGEDDRTLFEGLFISEETSFADGDPSSLTIHCLGALYQLDLAVIPPEPNERIADAAELIREVVTDSRHYTRITPPYSIAVGVPTQRSGTFDSGLTGAIADYLTQINQATITTVGPDPARPGGYRYLSAGGPWTVMKDPGRQMVLRRKKSPLSSTPEWTVTAGAPGIEAAFTRDLLSAPTAMFAEGTAADGCRWRNTKFPAYNAGAPSTADVRDRIDRARVLPVYAKPESEAWTYATDGSITGTNGSFDDTLLTVEKFVSAGERISLDAFAKAAQNDIESAWPAKYMGTLTVRDDPEEGHRRFIRSGHNIRVKAFRGRAEGQVFHISRVGVAEDGTVTMTVDQRSSDFSNVEALLARVRDANDLSKRGIRNQRKSQSVVDSFVPWDCESGSGRLPPVSVTANTWKVVRVAAAEHALIVQSSFKASVAARMSIAVFDRAITAATLTSAGNPLTSAGFWTNFTVATRPLISWGGKLPDGTDDAMGYYPGLQSESATLTGVFKDNGSWPFDSYTPPWMWVAIFSNTTCTVQGGTLADKYTAFRAGVN